MCLIADVIAQINQLINYIRDVSSVISRDAAREPFDAAFGRVRELVNYFISAAAGGAQYSR